MGVTGEPPWVNMASGIAARNGTTSHTISFGFTSTTGNLLVVEVFGAVTHTVSGWTERLSPVNSGELSVFTKTSAGETSITVTHNGSNYPVAWVAREYYTGSTYVGAGDSINDTSETFPTLTGLPGTEVVVHGARGRTAGGGSESSFSAVWSGSFVEDADLFSAFSSTDGFGFTSGHQINVTATSSTPTATSTYGGTWPTNDRERVSYAINAVASGTTPFTKDYVVLARVLNSFTKDYDVLARVLAAFTKDYVVLARVLAAFTKDYIVLARVLAAFTSDYVILARVLAAFTKDYVVLARVLAGFTKDYDILARVLASWTKDYVILADVLSGTQFTKDYVVLSRVLGTWTKDYTVLARVLAPFTKDYVVLADVLAGTAFTKNYVILADVRGFFTRDYVVLSRVLGWFSRDYIILARVLDNAPGGLIVAVWSGGIERPATVTIVAGGVEIPASFGSIV